MKKIKNVRSERKNRNGRFMPFDKKPNEDFNVQYPNQIENGLQEEIEASPDIKQLKNNR